MLKSLHISAFRGIPAELEIDFTSASGTVSSILLLGDNGSGKSSVADAIEFCLRGKVSRRGNAGAKMRYESRNLLTGANPSVQVTYDDGRHFARGALPSNFSGNSLGREFAPGFSLAPVVITRADIDVFWQVDSRERMRFFFDYLRDSIQHSGYTALEVEKAVDDLRSSESRVLQAQINLAKASDVPVAEIPINDRAAFYRWRRKAFPQYGPEESHPFGLKDAARLREIKKVPMPVRMALSALAQELETVHKLKKKIHGSGGQADYITQALPVTADGLPELLREVGAEVSAEFSAITNVAHVPAVRFDSSASGYELNVVCVLGSGEEVQPPQILSEASLDILALLILLGVARACASRGQTCFLVFDDVWQSVDSIYREAILQYVFARGFRDWQLLITVHDRLWARLIEEKARKENFVLKSLELVDWTPMMGPRLRSSDFDTAAQLSRLIDGDSPPEVLAAYAGRALEELSDKLSVSLGTSVTRRQGDRYTLEDLWPGVYKKLRKAEWNPELKQAAEVVNEKYGLRNIYGAHYAVSAESMAEAEIQSFAKAVAALWAAVRCGMCGVLLARRIGDGEVNWPCNHAQDG